MTPEPALLNWRSRGLASGGVSKKRRKKGSSSKGLRPGCSLMVPRVAILTTDGEIRLTIGASEGMGAESAAGDAGGDPAHAGAPMGPFDAALSATASAAAAILRRKFMRGPWRSLVAGTSRPDKRPASLPTIDAILHARTRPA